MRVLLIVLFSLIACVTVLATGAKRSERFTTHIGSRIPPVEAKCFQTGEVQTDEGKHLKVFQCPA